MCLCDDIEYLLRSVHCRRTDLVLSANAINLIFFVWARKCYLLLFNDGMRHSIIVTGVVLLCLFGIPNCVYFFYILKKHMLEIFQFYWLFILFVNRLQERPVPVSATSNHTTHAPLSRLTERVSRHGSPPSIKTEAPRQTGPESRVTGRETPAPPAYRRWVPPSLRPNHGLTQEAQNDAIFRKVSSNWIMQLTQIKPKLFSIMF